jgi:hypothetical protein
MTWSLIRRIILTCLGILLFAGTGLFAQTGTTSLRGTVTDPNGGSVPDAQVTLTSAAIGATLTTKTDKDGAYQFLEIRPATYTLTITAAGFATIRQIGLQLLVATPLTDNFKLELASVATTVEVSGAAQKINTQDATIGNAFNQSQISALPFEGRDPVSILSLQPGVVTVAARDQVDENADSRGGSVNGARSDQTNVTLDGIDNNDQTKGFALKGALRATLDSIDEFRVTTTNAGAEMGRSSGAQVAILTKSGTNDLHGSAYEYNRPTNLVANDWFNKHAQLNNNEPNVPPRLLRNTFGGSIGGAIKKDRIFYFAAYEGQRTRESSQTTRVVASDALRNGIIVYQCDQTDPNLAIDCPGGVPVTGLTDPKTGAPFVYTTKPGFNALGPAQIAQTDPNYSSANCPANAPLSCGPGVNLNAVATMRLSPAANSDLVGDGFNYRGFTFSAPTPNKLDTYVVKFDVNLTQSGTQRLFTRLGLENDHGANAPQFPGQPPASVSTNNSKGIIAGYTWTISASKVNNLRYGFIRQGVGDDGAGTQSFVFQRGLDLPQTDARATNVIVPLHNFADDFSWTRGKHTFSFGGNWRFVNDIRASNAASFSDATTNAGWLPASAIAGTGGSFDPGAFTFPAVDSNFSNGFDFPMMALAGLVTEVDAFYQRDKNGNLLPNGVTVQRHFRDNELDFYAQDAWHLKSNLTFTYGLRYSLLQPPYEINGNQVAPSISLHDLFNERMAAMVQGLSVSPTISVALAGPANGGKPYWAWDYKNLAPRFSVAWSPNASTGLLGRLFGGPGKSSIRLGAGIYYDHFGLGTVNSFDRNGSFGLTTTETSTFGAVTVDDAPRYSGPTLDLASNPLTPPAPTSKFPITPPNSNQPGGFTPYWGLDDKMKTPYSYDFDLSFSREIKGGFVFEAAYVGRLGRRLLQERDLAQPLNIVDPKSKTSLYQALTQLTKLGVANTDLSQIPAIPYWQNLFPGATGTTVALIQDPVNGLGCTGPPNSTGITTMNATQAIYFTNFCELHNETTTLQLLDLSCFPACATINGVQTQGLQYYLSQFPSLFAWQSIGRSNYNAGQFSIRHKVSHGLQWDFNYVYSKSIDIGSNAERINEYDGFGFASQILSAFDPGRNRAVSDYDATHQINSNWIYDLPFGRGQKWGSRWNRAVNALIGGWSWSGLYRWSSGFPFSVSNGFRFPTNWELSPNAVTLGPTPKTGLYTDTNGDPNAFAASTTANGTANLLQNSFRFAYAGESGNRNNFRGQGYFGIDTAVRKSWQITERQALSFTWDVYNITNSVRFGYDATQSYSAIDTAGNFGKYSQTLTQSRKMEFALRYSF